MQLSNAPAKLTLPFANAGGKNTVPVASQIGITPGAASYTDGFPPLTRTPLVSGGVPPSGLDMNGALFPVTALARWAAAGGGYPYDSTFANDSNIGGYPKGARVLRSDGFGYWQNTIDNQTTDPEAAGAVAAGWVPDFQPGIVSIALTNANVTLTPLQYGKEVIVLTGTLTASVNIIFPAALGKTWTVVNQTTGVFVVTLKTPSGAGIVSTNNQVVFGDGTNILGVQAFNPGIVRMFRVNTNQWLVRNPNGSAVDISATTTGGLQEAINAAVSGGWDLNVDGGGVTGSVYPGTDVATITATSSVSFPPMSNKNIKINSLTINFTLSGTSTPGFLFDSMKGCKIQTDCTINYTGNGQTVKFKPVGVRPADNLIGITNCYIEIPRSLYLAGGSDSTSACIGIDAASTGTMVNNIILFREQGGGGVAKYGFYMPDSLFSQNVVTIIYIHDVLNRGIQNGTTTGNTNTANDWRIGVLNPTASGSIGIETYASFETTNFAAVNGSGTLDIGIKLQTNTVSNIVTIRRAATVATAVFSDLGTAGSNIIFTTGKINANGLTFPATQVSSSGVNTLDDYVEGTFTASVTFDTPGNLALSAVSAAGSYTKIGRLVVVRFNWFGIMTFGGSASGNLRLTGLPYAVDSAGDSMPGAIALQNVTTVGFSSYNVVSVGGQTYCNVQASGSAATSIATVGKANIISGGATAFNFTLSYFAAT